MSPISWTWHRSLRSGWTVGDFARPAERSERLLRFPLRDVHHRKPQAPSRRGNLKEGVPTRGYHSRKAMRRDRGKRAISNARAQRKRMGSAEKRLWTLLRRGALGFRFRRQYPVGGFILDF